MPDLKNVSYCSLYCGTCFLLHDQVPDQAMALLNKFKEIEFDKWGKGLAAMSTEMKAFEHVDECYGVLAAWDHMRCSKPCRERGGSSACKVRACCLEKRLAGCWECPDCLQCAWLEEMKQVNGEMNMNNIREIRSQGVEAFVQARLGQSKKTFYE